jgi:parallel beta-helix repeat protein
LVSWEKQFEKSHFLAGGIAKKTHNMKIERRVSEVKKTASLTMISMILLLLIGMLSVALNIQPVKASGTICIRADGSIDPPDAPILSVDSITYTFADNIYDSIVVERDNIVADGAGYTVQGTGAYGSDGIYLAGKNNVTIRNVCVRKFYYGIYLDSSSNNNTIFGNNITANSEYGINLDYSSNNNVSGNNITGSYCGINLSTSSKNSISGNNMANNGYYGISLRSSLSNSIKGNNIANNWNGIMLYSSSNNNVSGNNITANNWYGIMLYSSSNNSMSGNNITANDGQGIWVGLSSNNNNVSGNNIANGWQGIMIQYSSGNNICGNNIANNGQGIWVGASNNRMYHNNFVNNGVRVYSELYVNTWDDGYLSGGNYWDNYTDVDMFSGPYQNETGGDGIRDHPYIIDGNNKDNYPLVSPYWYWSNPILGDINKDMKVDANDLISAAKALGSYPGHPRWNPSADINHDDKVNAKDIVSIIRNFGKTYT